MSFTEQQERAIAADGNILVVAGAGAGKTRTLVERCIRLVTGEKQVPVKNILVVTFTEAAAAEVRHRIRQRLDGALAERPEDPWLQEQTAFLDAAPISTLHGFCYALVREHFNELGLDPAVSVLPGEQAAVLKAQLLDELFMEHYRGEHDFSSDFQQVLRERYDGWEKPLRDFVFKAHIFTQTRPDPEGWFRAQHAMLEEPAARRWRVWYEEALRKWCQEWVPFLAGLPAENENAHACAELLRAACEGDIRDVPGRILAREDCFPSRKKGDHGAPFKGLFKEARFFASLGGTPGSDPLQEDWVWLKDSLRTLLRTAEQFAIRYGEAKRERSVLDFNDLEQCTLKLLWDPTAGRPTALAGEWQQRFEAIFVDEYQDINAAQDLILTALGREEPGNRFLVGDVKQSIYRFRQADPGIFQSYLKERTGWQRAVLSENFRSHEGLLAFINPLFAEIMQGELGGVEYDAEAELRFGGREQRAQLALNSESSPVVEVHLLRDNAVLESLEEDEDAPELDDTEEEARLIARRLIELRETTQIPAEDGSGPRAARWSDMVVLLRGVKTKVDTFAKVFHEFGVPLEARRNAFYSTQEVMDLVSVLQILDNPLQDVPLLAVLRSPLAGLGVNDLAIIRISASPRTSFWRALTTFHERKKQPETWQKVDAFLSKYHRWRRQSRPMSLCHRLEMILADTGYSEWITTQARGRQRYENIQQLLRIARDFDDARGENLYLFLRHIEELQEAAGDIEPAAVDESDAVRVMSIHQSKGLEFPIVVAAGLGTKVNLTDTRERILLDDEYGICAQVRPPDFAAPYPSLTHWLASRRQKAETLAEEIRILYVAFTRAQHRLLLFGAVDRKKEEAWGKANHAGRPGVQQLLKAQTYLDWIGPHLARRDPAFPTSDEGCAGVWKYQKHEVVPASAGQIEQAAQGVQLDPATIETVRERLLWTYPHPGSLLLSAKTTATALRRKADELENEDEPTPPVLKLSRGEESLERGTACHAFLERMTIAPGLTAAALQKEAADQAARGALTKAQIELIDFGAIAEFWNSPLGQELLAQAGSIRREMPFTARLDSAGLKRFRLAHLLSIPNGEFIVVQGIADLVLLLDSEIWLLDFKTDQVRRKELPRKVDEYRAQIEVYSLALESIFCRPVKRRFLHFLTARKTEEVEGMLL